MKAGDYTIVTSVTSFQTPRSANEWNEIADGFTSRWNFPHCVGALDGKHVVLVKPRKSGSVFLNYKYTFSIVLMAIVDCNYKFIYVNVGAQGRLSDAGVFNNCRLWRALQSNELNFPDPDRLPNSGKVLPYVLVADDAFPLTTNIMKPYSRRTMDLDERIFNYRLSRARRIVENAFGILSAKFRVFRSPIALKTSSARSLVLAAVCLHNFIRQRLAETDDDDDSVDTEDLINGVIMNGKWRESSRSHGFRNLFNQPGRQNSEGKHVRNELKSYFCNEGAVEWQLRFV
jgi:hypothetical protein